MGLPQRLVDKLCATWGRRRSSLYGMADVQDVAAAVIERAGTVDPMKLQKLLYYVQGWSEAWRGQPMFEAPVEAWRYGPVVDEVYQTYKSYGRDPIDGPREGSPSALSPDERQTLNAVCDRYSSLASTTLGDLTHEDDAWLDAWERRGSADRGRQVIDPDEIAKSLRRASAFGHPNQRHPIDVEPALVDRAWAGDGDALQKLFSLAGADIQASE